MLVCRFADFFFFTFCARILSHGIQWFLSDDYPFIQPVFHCLKRTKTRKALRMVYCMNCIDKFSKKQSFNNS